MNTALLELCDVLMRAARYGHDPAQRLACTQHSATLAGELRAQPASSVATSNDEPSGFAAAYARAVELALRGADELADSEASDQAVLVVMRAARYVAYVMELLYPYARDDARLDAWFSQGGAAPAPSAQDEDVGVGHLANERGTQGGCSLYVPESYSKDGPALPLIIALHGGAGHGRTFLWSWLRHARTRNCIVLSPTSVGDTWSLMQPEVDVANICRMIEWMMTRWHIDTQRVLLTGMSDGGTFSLLGGMQANFPCTHIAPVSASFHPVMLEMVDRARVQRTALHLTHGRHDWMFPVAMARQAEQAFEATGADVVLTEIDDLAHTYPHEHNSALLDWFFTTSVAVGAPPLTPPQ